MGAAPRLGQAMPPLHVLSQDGESRETSTPTPPQPYPIGFHLAYTVGKRGLSTSMARSWEPGDRVNRTCRLCPVCVAINDACLVVIEGEMIDEADVPLFSKVDYLRGKEARAVVLAMPTPARYAGSDGRPRLTAKIWAPGTDLEAAKAELAKDRAKGCGQQAVCD